MTREELQFSIRTLLHAPEAAAFTAIVQRTPAADIVEALEGVDPARLAPLLMVLSQADRTELFAYLPNELQAALLPRLPRPAVVALFENLPSDDRADLFNRLSEAAREQLLPALAKVERDDILRLAAYPEGSVGSVTTSDCAAVGATLSAAEALQQLRVTAPDKETIYVLYVLDADRRLQGTVSLRDLVLASPGARLADLMQRSPVFARADWPRADAADLIRRYDLLALPVALALGIAIAVLEAILAHFSKGVGADVLWVVGLTMLTVTVLGGIIGGVLPFLARRLGTDPATLSSRAITSIMDLLGVLIHFSFAYAFLGHMMVGG